MLNPSQQLQVSDWLRQTDRCIRDGRYVAADEILQKVFKLSPENTTARVYQDRILFLVNQLSHRLGLQPELQAEIRRYRELQRTRNANLVNTQLLEAKKLLDSGHFDRANEYITQALAIDPENMYAKGLQQRLGDLRGPQGKDPTVEREYLYRSLLMESWTRGTPSADQARIISATREKLHLTDEQVARLELEAKSSCYRDALQELWSNGGLVGFTDETIAGLMEQYSITRLDHARVEAELLHNVRKNRIRGTALLVLPEDALLKELVYTLRLHAYSVIAAVSADEALASLHIGTPDIILSALEFPGKGSGFDLYQSVRSLPELRSVPFLFIAPSFDRTTQIIGRRLGVDEFITVPIDYEMLFATMTGRLNATRGER